jgi:hypothetical protein
LTLRAERDGSFTYTAADLELRFVRPRLAGSGAFSGVWSEVLVTHNGAHVHEARYNLSSLTSRRELAKYLATRAELPKPLTWVDTVETACTLMCREMHRGKAIIDLAEVADPGEPSYVVAKLILERQLNILYGEAEAGKSLLTCALAYAVAAGDSVLLGLRASQQDVWYLDWETDEAEVTRRLRRISRGFGLEEIPPIHYIHMDRPLSEEGETVAKITGGVAFIDSLTPACGGDIIRPESPTSFWNIVRAIPGSVVIIGQTQKGEKGSNKTVLGSGVFTYMGRSAWEIVGCQDADTVHVAAFHRKCNMGKKWQPMAWRFEFDDTARTLRVATEEIDAVGEFAARQTLTDQVGSLLIHGSATVKDIAAQLDLKENAVRSILNRHRNRFVKVGDEWGLLARMASQ